jgi:hypothetical protein
MCWMGLLGDKPTFRFYSSHKPCFGVTGTALELT